MCMAGHRLWSVSCPSWSWTQHEYSVNPTCPQLDDMQQRCEKHVVTRNWSQLSHTCNPFAGVGNTINTFNTDIILLFTSLLLYIYILHFDSLRLLWLCYLIIAELFTRTTNNAFIRLIPTVSSILGLSLWLDSYFESFVSVLTAVHI